MAMFAFGTLASCALILAFLTKDWRLKTVATACFALWTTTALFVEPQLKSPSWVDPLYTIILFLIVWFIQSRGEVERRRGEPLAMWLLVPMGVEAVIAVSYVAEMLFLAPLAQLLLIQVGFAIELVCIIVVAGRRLRLWQKLRDAWRGAKTLRPLTAARNA